MCVCVPPLSTYQVGVYECVHVRACEVLPGTRPTGQGGAAGGFLIIPGGAVCVTQRERQRERTAIESESDGDKEPSIKHTQSHTAVCIRAQITSSAGLPVESEVIFLFLFGVLQPLVLDCCHSGEIN